MDYSCTPYSSYSELIKAEPLKNLKSEVLERKHKERKEKEQCLKKFNTIIVPAVVLATVVTVSTLNVAKASELQVEKKSTDVVSDHSTSFLDRIELKPVVEEKPLQQQLDDFVFWSKMRAFERQETECKLQEEAAKAQQAEKEWAENLFSTMQEMTIESQLSIKLTRISDNLDKLSALTEKPAEGKPLEKKIVSRMDALKKELFDYPQQFESLKIFLRSEKKRLKKCIQLRKDFEKAERVRRKAEEARRRAQAEAMARFEADKYLLAQIIFCEAGCTEGGQDSNYNDMVYSGSVVLNRARTNYHSFSMVSTISEVLYQPGQYSPHTKEKIARGVKPYPSDLEVAQGLLDGSIPCLPEYILYQTADWQDWMSGQVKSAGLNAKQFYGIPLDFE